MAMRSVAEVVEAVVVEAQVNCWGCWRWGAEGNQSMNGNSLEGPTRGTNVGQGGLTGSWKSQT